MAQSRSDLSDILHKIQGNDHIYYQPPESIKIEIPGIIYSKSDIDVIRADNRMYINHDKYTLICLSLTSDNPVVKLLIERLPMCSYDRSYTKNNVYHDVLTVYF